MLYLYSRTLAVSAKIWRTSKSQQDLLSARICTCVG